MIVTQMINDFLSKSIQLGSYVLYYGTGFGSTPHPDFRSRYVLCCLSGRCGAL